MATPNATSKRWTKSELDSILKRAYSTNEVDHDENYEDLPLGYVNVPQPIAKSVLISTITMQDDSMDPVFCKGDVLTISKDREIPTPGHYYLIMLGELLLVRRFIYTEAEDWLYMAESYCEKPIVDGKVSIKHLGVVTAVHRVDGTSEVLDLDKLEMWSCEEKAIEADVPVAA